MPEVLTFRQSEFSSFKRCRRQWALNYRVRLERRRYKPSKAGVGMLWHVAAEAHYNGTGDPLVAMGMAWAADAAKLETAEEVETYRDQLVLAEIMWRGYVEWLEESGADAGLTITGVEREIVVPFSEYLGVPVFVTGKVDLEVIDVYGQPKLIDHKTRDSLTIGAHDGMDEQRLTYSVLRMLEDRTQYTGAIHNLIKRVKRTKAAKPPFYARHEIVFTLEQIRNRHRQMWAMAQDMAPLALSLQEGTLSLDDPRLYPRVHRDCDWDCPFLDVCPMMDDGSDWRWMLDEFYRPAADVAPDREE